MGTLEDALDHRDKQMHRKNKYR